MPATTSHADITPPSVIKSAPPINAVNSRLRFKKVPDTKPWHSSKQPQKSAPESPSQSVAVKPPVQEKKLARQQLLQSISGLPQPHNLPKGAQPPYFLNPQRQQLYRQARQQGQSHSINQKNELDQLTVDEMSEEIGGYRFTIINGRCWMIPTENDFDSLTIQMMGQDLNCEQAEENPLAERLEKWKTD